jgi:hypothetical protein
MTAEQAVRREAERILLIVLDRDLSPWSWPLSDILPELQPGAGRAARSA